MVERWVKWAFLEALTRTASMTVQKFLGFVSATLAHSVFAAVLVGLVQTIAGFIVVRSQRKSLLDSRANILGSVLFGLIAFVATVLGFVIYRLGGEVGIYTFILTLSIVPGAIIDRVFFGHRLNLRQWIGIAIGVFAGYTILGWPSYAEALRLPLWVWIAVFNTLLVAVNQGITQRIKDVDPFVKNFWGGLTAMILGGLSLILLPAESIVAHAQLSQLILFSLIIGGIVVLMWACNVLSYKTGAYIALKKLVVNGCFLSTAAVAGIWLFGEKITNYKISGLLLYMSAFILVDQGTWDFVSRKSTLVSPHVR